MEKRRTKVLRMPIHFLLPPLHRRLLPLAGVALSGLLLQACVSGGGPSGVLSDSPSDASPSSKTAMSAEPSTETAMTVEPSTETAMSAEPSEAASAPAYEPASAPDAAALSAVIDKALDEITSSPLESSNTEDYIGAHPEAVQTILALGDQALPLLSAIYDNGDRGLRGAVAVSLCNRIHSGLNRVGSVSPDGRFRTETYGIMTSTSSGGLYPAEGIRLVEQDTGTVVWSMEPGYYLTSFLWSSDSRYVAVYYMARIYGTSVVVDTQTMTAIELPTMEALQQATKTDITQRDFRPDPYLEPIEWLDDERLEIKFTWVGAKEQDVAGRFVFRVADGAVESLTVQ